MSRVTVGFLNASGNFVPVKATSPLPTTGGGGGGGGGNYLPLGTTGVTPTTSPYVTLSNNGAQSTLHLISGEGFTGPYVLGIGSDYGNVGLYVSNKRTGIGSFITNEATVTGGAAYALRVVNYAPAAPGASFQVASATAEAAVEFTANAAASLQDRKLLRVNASPGGTFTEYGSIRGNGIFIWNNVFRIDSLGFLDHRGTLNFFGASGATGKTKQTVTGSRGANAALASLLTALATYGLITDSSVV